MADVVIETLGLAKVYKRDEFQVTALKNCSLEINKGEFVALMGPSGSGKSTLLHLIAAMDRPTEGKIAVLGEDLRSLNDRAIARWRNEHIGFIFQTFNLIPVLTALENVELPLKLTKLNKKERLEHARTALNLVGLGDRVGHLPRQLSGGQEQRVAIARAIVTDPLVLLADEPTGNLDPHTAQHVFDTLTQLVRASGLAAIIATHNLELARRMDRRVTIQEGMVVEMA